MVVGYWLYQGKMMKRGYQKPRGYPGDYKMLEGMYDNVPWTKDGIGYLWDKFFINVDYVKSVRKRKDALKKILNKFLNGRANTEVSIMNLGSGSGREVRELFSRKLQYKIQIRYSFIDQDQKSLDYIKTKIKNLNIPFLQCNYINENLITTCRKISRGSKQYGMQDLIYSIGVADYLPDEFCKELFQSSFRLLNKKGLFVVAFKLTKRYKSLCSDWLCDWHFYERSKQEVIKLIKDGLRENRFKFNFIITPETRILYVGIEKI
jgi:16S rRNA G966 N2-methylase RsmD